MSAVAGYVESFSLFGRNLSPVADVEVNIQLGGDNNDVEMNGDDTGRLIKSKMPWSLDGLVVSNDHEKEDHEYIQDAASRKTFGDITIGLADGVIYQGVGQITGKIAGSSQKATIPIALKGIGVLTQQ